MRKRRDHKYLGQWRSVNTFAQIRQLASFDFAHDPHQYDRAQNRNQDGVNGAALPGKTEQPHDPAAYYSANNAKDDIAEGAKAGAPHDFARCPPGNQDPPQEMQHPPSFCTPQPWGRVRKSRFSSRPSFAAAISLTTFCRDHLSRSGLPCPAYRPGSRSNPSHPNLNLMVTEKISQAYGTRPRVLRLKPCPVYNHLFACSRFFQPEGALFCQTLFMTLPSSAE